MSKETRYLQCVMTLMDSWVEKYNEKMYQDDNMLAFGVTPTKVTIDQKLWNVKYKKIKGLDNLSAKDIEPLADMINNAVNNTGIRVNFRSNIWLFCGNIYPILTLEKDSQSDLTIDQLKYRLS